MTNMDQQGSIDARKIAQTDLTKGDAAAYQLYNQVLNHVASNGNLTEAQQQSYWKTLQDTLVHDRVLPDLSIAWVQQQSANNPGETNFDAVGHKGPHMTQQDLTDYIASQPSVTKGPADKNLVMAQTLAANYFQIAAPGTQITRNDIATAQTDQQYRIENEPYVNALLQKLPGTNETLFDEAAGSLATVGGVDHLPDAMTQQDFQTLVKEHDFQAQTGALKPDDWLAQIYPATKFFAANWNTPQAKQLQEQIQNGPVAIGDLGTVTAITKGNLTNAQKLMPLLDDSNSAAADIAGTLTAQQETQIVDVLAKNPTLLNGIADGDTISKVKVDAALDQISKSNTPSSNTDRQVLSNLRSLFTSSENTISLNALTEQSFDGKQTFPERLARDGNLPISIEDQASVRDYLNQHPSLVSFLNLNGKEGFKSNLDRLLAGQNGQQESPDFIKAITMLHDSFSSFSRDGNSYDS